MTAGLGQLKAADKQRPLRKRLRGAEARVSMLEASSQIKLADVMTRSRDTYLENWQQAAPARRCTAVTVSGIKLTTRLQAVLCCI